MAERRMFAKTIIDSDAFLDMPLSAQALYFHLSMRADDDGFVASPKRIIKLIGATEDDYKILIAKKFVIPFESGVCVITDWRINNYLRNDRYTETIYKEEKDSLVLDEKGKYNLGIPLVDPVLSLSNTNTNIYNKEENQVKEERHKHGEYGWIKLTDDQYNRLKSEYSNIDKIIDRIDEYVQSNGNKNKYKDWNLVIRKAIREKWSCLNDINNRITDKVYTKEELDSFFSNLDEVEV